MKKQCNLKAFITIYVLLVFNLLCFFSIRSMWSGIIAMTFHALPYLLCFVLFLVTLAMSIGLLEKKCALWLTIIAGVFDVLFLGLNVYIISVTLDSYLYFIREFLYSLIYVAGICAVLLFLHFLAKKKWMEYKYVPAILVTGIVIGSFLFFFQVTPFNGFTSTPVVYAVGNEYQIVFTTFAKGEAWVEIDGVDYNDTYAGYRRSEDTVHKISVPMEVLDNSSEYTICTRAMFLRGPYCALQGQTLQKSYSWKGVDTSNGLNYYVLSDTHTNQSAPIAAAGYFKDNLDFLISCGDNVNWIDRTADLKEMLSLAGAITKGEIPVIYARGNHETKGIRADEFYRYTGADGENFYYTFRLKNIWGVVLDLGEDSPDDYVEFSGMAKFEEYRKEQTAFLDAVLENADTEFAAEGVDYRIGICHIPLSVKSEKDASASYKDAWVERLNQMQLTVMYSGHIHELWYIDPVFEDNTTLTQVKEYSGKDGKNDTRIMTAATFPTILVSRRSTTQLPSVKENVFDKHFIGLAVTVTDSETILQYTNEKQEILSPILSPWFSDISYQDTITVPNK